MKSQEERYGKSIIRVMPDGDGFRGVVIRDKRQGPILQDDDRDRLIARLRNEAGRLHPDYVGFDGAIGRFKTYFPDGFRDARFIAMERDYKVAARNHLVDRAPLETVLAHGAFDLASVRKAYQPTCFRRSKQRGSRMSCGATLQHVLSMGPLSLLQVRLQPV
jgi:hypothetical protein